MELTKITRLGADFASKSGRGLGEVDCFGGAT
jgi:hypothetical protein